MCGGIIGGDVPKSLNIPPNVHLSRITQRFAREAQALKDVNEFRSKADAPLLRENLLKQDVKLGVALRVPEDPVDSLFSSEPIVPEGSLAFGGEIGQWGENGNDAEKFGVILKASRFSSEAHRATLNIHVRGLVLEAHPLFIDEERLAVRLKQQFSQYSVLYERGAIFYLVKRLKAVMDSLEQLLATPFSSEDSDEELVIAYLAGDLKSTVPAIAELRKVTQSITSSVYETWKGIKEERARQGFTSTRVNLSVIAVKKMTEESVRSQDEIEEADGIWRNLRERLGTISGLLYRSRTRRPVSSSASTGRRGIDGGGIVTGEINDGDDASSSRETLHTKNVESKLDDVIKACIDELQSLPTSTTSGSRGTRAGGAVVSARGNEDGLIPSFVYMLSDEGDITPDVNCPVLEQQRRRSIQKTIFRSKLNAEKLIAGNYDSSTHYIPLQFPGFTLDFTHIFQISLLHQPTDLKIDLYTNLEGSWASDIHASSIVIPIPGQHLTDMLAAGSSSKKLPMAAAYAPIAAPYSFVSPVAYTIATSM